MDKKKCFLLFASITGIATVLYAASLSNSSFNRTPAVGCTHSNVEHYASDNNHVEHWACCKCHTAWSDSGLTNVIGNTISDRSQIDLVLHYSFNENTNKIEYCRGTNVLQEITPTYYVSTLKFHANNSNVMQFKAGSLKDYVTNNLTILNYDDVYDSFNLTDETKKTLVYWGDSQTFGFQQSNAFVSFGLNSHIYCKNLILTNGSQYYIIGQLGSVFSERTGTMKNVSGIFENKSIYAMQSGGNYYIDLATKIDTTFWSISSDEVGTDWTYSGGTSYLIEKNHNGITTTFAHVTSSIAAGTFPSGIKEATLKVRNQSIQHLRLGIDSIFSFVEGDQLILKAGSIFTDDANGNDAVYVKNDIILFFTGEMFVLNLGNVDLANSYGQYWNQNQLVLSMPHLQFDLNYFYLNQCEGEWASNEHAVLSKIELEFNEIKRNIKHYNSNTYNSIVYFNNNDLVGIKGSLDVNDGYAPSLNDTLTIKSGSYICINCVGCYFVDCGVTFRLSKMADDCLTIGWTNIANESEYDMPTYDMTKSIHIGASNDLNSSKIIDHSTGEVSTSILAGLKNGGFNLLTGNYTVIENDGHKNNLLSVGKNYGIDFILKPRSDWTTDQDYVEHTASNFLGYEMKDEPSLSDKDSFKMLKQTFDTKSYKNKYFFTNLQPIYAESTYIGDNYETYVKSFVEDCNFNILSWDNYSLYQDKRFSISSWSGTKLRDNWLSNFSICSYYANKNNIPLWYTFLSSQHNLSKTYRYIDPSAEEMAYQMYVGMAFGAKGLVHYVLEHDGTNDTETNMYGTTLIDSNANFTESFNKANKANHLIRSWDNVYMNHEWLGISGVQGSKNTYSGFLGQLSKSIGLTSTNILQSASSTGDLLISHFNSNDNHKALMLTNYMMPSDSTTSSVSLKFNDSYKAVKIYGENSVIFKELEDGMLNIDIKPGSAVFVTPVCKL